MCHYFKDLHKLVNQYSASKAIAKKVNRQDTYRGEKTLQIIHLTEFISSLHKEFSNLNDWGEK